MAYVQLFPSDNPPPVVVEYDARRSRVPHFPTVAACGVVVLIVDLVVK